MDEITVVQVSEQATKATNYVVYDDLKVASNVELDLVMNEVGVV